MVSTAVSKMGMPELIFVDPGMKFNGQYYHDVLLSQQMLSAIKHVAGDTFVFQQDNAPSHRAKDTTKLLQQETLDFIGPDLWPSNSPDLHLADYKIWGVMQQRVYECHVNSVYELKQRLVEVWNRTACSRTFAATNEWRKRRMQMDNNNILNIYCERV